MAETPTLQAIIARVKADFRSILGVDALLHSVEYAFIYVQAALSKAQYAYGKYVKDQGFPDTADSVNFWRHAAIRGISQNPATPWQGTYTFTGTDTTAIPALTELSRSDGALYETVALTAISGTDVTTDIIAKVGYEGSTYNNDDGQPLTLSTPIAGVDSTGEVASTTIDGSDLETEEDGLTRYLADIQSPPSGGGPGDYVRWAREVAGVTRAWEGVLGANEVGLSFVRDNDGAGAAIIPSGGEVTEVQDYLDSVAPITVTVTVFAPTPVTVDIEIADLVYTGTLSAVQAAIELELIDFFAREGEPGASIPLSRINEAISLAAGEVSHTLVLPAADVVLAADELGIYVGPVTYS